jgi:streptomycin 6-kinase
MVSLPLVQGGWIDIDPREVAAIRSIESAGLILNGKCEVALRGGARYEINYSASTVKDKLRS